MRHEIDLWVEVVAEYGYSSVFVFEAKNWKRKVSKNDVIIFNHKIEAASAQRGFLIAKDFSSDARNQAKQFPRLELKAARELRALELPTAIRQLHGLRDFDLSAKVVFSKALSSKTFFESLRGIDIQLGGRNMSADTFVAELAQDFYLESLTNFNSTSLEPGVYPHVFKGMREYGSEELLVAGEAMRAVELDAQVKLEIARAILTSSFEVEGRGRSYSCEINFADGTGVHMDFSQTMDMFRKEQEAGGGHMRVVQRRTYDGRTF